MALQLMLWCAGMMGTVPVHAQWTWQPQFHTDNRLRDLRLLPDGSGMAIGEGNVLLCTVNGGETWTGTGSAAPDLNAASLVGTSVYFGNREGGIFVLNNPATCFSDLVAIATPALSNLTDLHMVSSTAGYAAANGSLRFSNNAWNSSTAVVNLNCPFDAQAVWFLNQDLGFAATQSGRITRVSQESGTFLCETVASGSQPLHNLHFANEQVGFAVGALGTVLATVDSGRTWQARSIPTTDDLKAVFATGPFTVHAAGDQLYRSTDGGLVWEIQNKPSAMTQAESLWFIDANNGWVAGANGFLGYTGNAGGSGLVLHAQVPEQQSQPWSFAPNPASQQIQLWTESPEPTSWSLWDSMGRRVKNGVLIGSTLVALDELPAGLYWLKAGTLPAKSLVIQTNEGTTP
ncbi:MAG: hypothetical protein GC205_10290 [Bacteroidetes bacterium]|nr:hypothetical protein [Bacteroidota bacterium]